MIYNFYMKKQKIVTIGGGSGSFMVLSGLKKLPVELSAIVSMTDDGGSNGILRDELGVLPPSDVRQCLVALSSSSQVLREMFKYRFSQGGLNGHTFGNLFLSTLEKITGSFDKAVEEAGRILRIKGWVFPVTLKNARLVALLNSGRKIISEDKIYRNARDLVNLKRLYLKPAAALNPRLKEIIRQADKIVINPGDLYSSIIPNFLVKGMPEALRKSRAEIIFIGNLMTKPGHTDGFTLVDYAKSVEKYAGRGIIDCVIYNKEQPDKKLLKKYSRQGENPVWPGDISRLPKIKFIGYNLLSHQVYKPAEGDVLGKFRSLVRHDSDKLAKVIYDL